MSLMLRRTHGPRHPCPVTSSGRHARSSGGRRRGRPGVRRRRRVVHLPHSAGIRRLDADPDRPDRDLHDSGDQRGHRAGGRHPEPGRGFRTGHPGRHRPPGPEHERPGPTDEGHRRGRQRLPGPPGDGSLGQPGRCRDRRGRFRLGIPPVP
ncbi:hypothetical protein NOCARDAX2BIS_80015 [Nocardioides sp. AX2bis]|nr:hypothetical protein NOCARDAX2BIS_80015 [Nocardioides sp. AX2bis]